MLSLWRFNQRILLSWPTELRLLCVISRILVVDWVGGVLLLCRNGVVVFCSPSTWASYFQGILLSVFYLETSMYIVVYRIFCIYKHTISFIYAQNLTAFVVIFFLNVLLYWTNSLESCSFSVKLSAYKGLQEQYFNCWPTWRNYDSDYICFRKAKY